MGSLNILLQEIYEDKNNYNNNKLSRMSNESIWYFQSYFLVVFLLNYILSHLSVNKRSEVITTNITYHFNYKQVIEQFL